MNSKLLLIGWDAADWRVADPLIAAGAMPHLARLIEGGTRGNIRTLYPILSPMLWTSIATGKRPDKHGIHGFSEVDPESGAIRPISGRSRQTKAIWNILGQNGLKSNVVGWWPSHPAEPVNGTMVSNFFHHMPAKKSDFGDRLPAGTAHPRRLLEELAPFRVHPDELNANHLGPFLPNYAQMNWREDQRVHTCARMLAECTSIHSAATGIMQLEPWDFMGVYYDAIDHFSHGFMRYHPPMREGISEEDFENFKDVVTSAYRFHDLMLGTLLQLAGEDTTVILMSDHGFHPDHQRLRSLSNEPAAPAAEHRSQGIFVARGPGIPAGEEIEGISLLDITPSILRHFGLAVGADMDGTPIDSLFPGKAPSLTIPSWDLVPGDDGCHPPGSNLTHEESEANLQQLIDLGYIDRPDERIAVARKETQRELDYNLARALMDGHQFAKAAALLRRLWSEFPEEYRFAMQLVTCHERLGRHSEASQLIRDIIQAKSRYIEDNKDAVQEEVAALKKRQENGESIPESQLRKMRRLMAGVRMNRETLDQLQIRAFMHAGEHQNAAREADAALERFPKNLNILLLRSRLHAHDKQWERAEALYRRILEIEPLHEPTFIGLAYIGLQNNNFWQAASDSKAAIALAPQNAWGHYYHGCALLRLSKRQLGLKSLQRAVDLNPDFVEAWDRLARFYSRAKKIPNAAEKAESCRRNALTARERRENPIPLSTEVEPIDASADIAALEEDIEKRIALFREAATQPSPRAGAEVTVVTGLPRSGTSLLMQMLRAGGIEPLSDGTRAPDENNLKGFFEFEPVKKGRDFADWMPAARGKAVKIIAPLLPALPKGETYRAIFCHRPQSQILASQRKMISRLHGPGNSAPSLERSSLVQVRRALEFLRRAGIPVLVIDYTSAIADPADAARHLNTFLGGHLAEDAMAAAIDPELHRERSPAPPADDRR